MLRTRVPVHLTQKTNFSGEKNASNTDTDNDKSQHSHFQSAEMNELRQPSTPWRVADEWTKLG